MKLIIQAVSCLLLIHIIYFAGTIGWAYVKAIDYTLETFDEYNNIYLLQNEVAVGFIGSPGFVAFTFVGVAILSGFIIKETEIRLIKIHKSKTVFFYTNGERH